MLTAHGRRLAQHPLPASKVSTLHTRDIVNSPTSDFEGFSFHKTQFDQKTLISVNCFVEIHGFQLTLDRVLLGCRPSHREVAVRQRCWRGDSITGRSPGNGQQVARCGLWCLRSELGALPPADRKTLKTQAGLEGCRRPRSHQLRHGDCCSSACSELMRSIPAMGWQVSTGI